MSVSFDLAMNMVEAYVCSCVESWARSTDVVRSWRSESVCSVAISRYFDAANTSSWYTILSAYIGIGRCVWCSRFVVGVEWTVRLSLLWLTSLSE